MRKNMKNISKIFGAVAIIGLFLVCSMSTGLAGQQVVKGQQQVPGQQQYVIAYQYGDGTYSDGAYQVGTQYGAEYSFETAPYNPDPNVTPLLFGHDVCTVAIGCFPVTDVLIIWIRNIGSGDLVNSATVKITAFNGFELSPIFYNEQTLLGLGAHHGKFYLAGPVPFSSSIGRVRVHIQNQLLDGEGLIRGLNLRIGFVQNII